jgi:hypothetical protein
MDMTPQEYQALVKARKTPSPLLKDTSLAFLTGGAICVMGQLLVNGYGALGLGQEGRHVVGIVEGFELVPGVAAGERVVAAGDAVEVGLAQVFEHAVDVTPRAFGGAGQEVLIGIVKQTLTVGVGEGVTEVEVGVVHQSTARSSTSKMRAA